MHDVTTTASRRGPVVAMATIAAAGDNNSSRKLNYV
jgi:hypothetical protein